MKYDENGCHFNMDTGCVELVLRDGKMISIDCTGVEDALNVQYEPVPSAMRQILFDLPRCSNRQGWPGRMPVPDGRSGTVRHFRTTPLPRHGGAAWSGLCWSVSCPLASRGAFAYRACVPLLAFGRCRSRCGHGCFPNGCAHPGECR